MSNKEEEKISEVEDKKLSDEELDNVSGGVAVIGKKKLESSGTTVKPVTSTGKTV